MESVMSDFLTRLVTATYIPAASVRPRPVAHYEPMQTSLPLWSYGAEPSPAVMHDEVAAQAPSVVKPLAALSVPAKHSSLSIETAGESTRAATAPLTGQTTALHQDATKGRSDSLATRAETERDKQKDAAAHRSIVARSQETAGNRHLASERVLQPSQSPHPQTGVAAPAPVAPTPTALSPASARREFEPVRPSAAPLRAAATPDARITRPAIAATPDPTRQHDTVVAPTTPASLAARREALVFPLSISGDEHALPGDQHSRVQPTLHSAHRLPAAKSVDGAASITDAVSTTPPAPVVRVTIGRIVVKAENAAPTKGAPAHPAPPSRPALSLDQYLKARSGGDA
jgi:hypothetical protein